MGHGYFQQAINANDQSISDALDQIPLTGDVVESDYMRFLDFFRPAFEKTGVGTATRLLAMKRPDYFVCLDNKNKRKLCDAFKIPKKVTLDDYWGSVVARLTDSNWWNAGKPDATNEMRIWLGRAAFLDVLFYEPG